MSADSEPKYHHFIPQFYLGRWADSGRRLCRFSKPYDKIVPKMVSTRGTGGQDGLYSLKSVSPENAQWMESGPLKDLDTAANHALDILERNDSRILQPGPRSNWSRFLMSMMMRGPKDIELIKAEYAKDWQAELAGLVEKLANSENLHTRDMAGKVPDMLKPGSPLVEDWAVEVAIDLMDHSGLGGLLNGMHWIVRDIPSEGPELLTSDRPIRTSDTLVKSDDFLIMPIGPRKLFVAVTSEESTRRVLAYDPAEQAKAVNKFVVGAAQDCVYGTSDAQLEFVRQNMSTSPEPSMFERLAYFRR